MVDSLENGHKEELSIMSSVLPCAFSTNDRSMGNLPSMEKLSSAFGLQKKSMMVVIHG